MRKVLITGRIGSGKSEVSKILGALGYSVYDSDSRTKALYADPVVAQKIESEVGVELARMGKVFENPELLKKLESVVHPLVLSDFERFAAQSASDPVFFESAIAADKPLFDGVFDDVILVRAPYRTRVKRNEKAAVRDAFQREPSRYDFLIENDGSLEELKEKTELILRQL